MMPRSITNGLVILIALVWAANAIVGFFEPARSSSAVNGIFLAVIGAIGLLGAKGPDSPIAAARRRVGRAIAGPPATSSSDLPTDTSPDQEEGAQ